MNEEKTMLEGSGEIKEKVLKLEEKILRIFFECAMYQALGEKWKDKTIVRAREKVLRNDHAMNYKSLTEAYDKKQDFAITDLDITALAALIVYDFSDVCCCYKGLDVNQLKKLVGRIRENRNQLSHSSENSDILGNVKEGLERVNSFVTFLKESDWQYEENEKFREYLQKTDAENDGSKTFLETIEDNVLDCAVELENIKKQDKKSYDKNFNIEFVDEDGQALSGVLCNITSKLKKKVVFKGTGATNLFVLLSPDEYDIVCSAVPQGYNDFELQRIRIQASDDNNIYQKIVVKKKGDKESKPAGEALPPPQDQIAEAEEIDIDIDSDFISDDEDILSPSEEAEELFEEGCRCYHDEQKASRLSDAFHFF